MPYIKQEHREKLDKHIEALVKAINAETNIYIEQAGILNYCCTKLALEIIPVRSYWAIALKSGVLHNIADEFYRRYASVYEDEKIKTNGDVYPTEGDK